MKNYGRITIPTDSSFAEGTKKIALKWGADAVRDCDGTDLPANAAELADKVYQTYFVTRGDSEWAENNPDEWQHVYLMTPFTLAEKEVFEIPLLNGYLPDQIEPDYTNPQKYWEVIDRTTGDLLDNKKWSVNEKSGSVIIKNASPFHEYTVAFLAVLKWEPTHMYNYITNGWDGYKHNPYDPYYPKTNGYIKRRMDEWCKTNPQINVVRFTTFLYHFNNVFSDKRKEKNVHWFGYTMAVSPRALDDFEKEYGYKMRAEYFVSAGQYDSTFRIPAKEIRDYMDFVEKFVAQTAKELVEIVHKYKKEAMMFLGDCWIGTEPYGKYFSSIGLDAVVGSVGGGVTVRMLSDMPGVKYTEGRLLPYFFPDTFFEGNEHAAIDELNRNWITARRAIMRNPIDRIGFGGYLSLAAKFPKFIDRAADVCQEFRDIYDNVKGKKPKNFLTVGVLNAWGKKRSWMCYMVAHELWYRQCYSYAGIMEALSGLPVRIEFMTFDDVADGIPDGIDVILNAGNAGTSWSGGGYWTDEKILTNIRKFIHSGGGFIGIGEPSAIDKNGRYFQLADALGVEKELGFTQSEDKYNIDKKEHFIFADVTEAVDYGEGQKGIYALPSATVLDIDLSDRVSRRVNVGEVKAAVNTYGKGRCFYAAGLPYSFQNSRILYRALLWTAGKENELFRAYSSNPLTECNYYEETKKYAIINNTVQPQSTVFYSVSGRQKKLDLRANEIKWLCEDKE